MVCPSLVVLVIVIDSLDFSKEHPSLPSFTSVLQQRSAFDLLELSRSGILRRGDDLLRAGLLRRELLEAVALDVVLLEHRTAERAVGLDLREVASHPEVIDVHDVDHGGDELSTERPPEPS